MRLTEHTALEYTVYNIQTEEYTMIIRNNCNVLYIRLPLKPADPISVDYLICSSQITPFVLTTWLTLIVDVSATLLILKYCIVKPNFNGVCVSPLRSRLVILLLKKPIISLLSILILNQRLEGMKLRRRKRVSQIQVRKK